jgi:hypothetical protein
LSPFGGGRGREKKNSNLKNNILKFQFEGLSPSGGGRGRKKAK